MSAAGSPPGEIASADPSLSPHLRFLDGQVRLTFPRRANRDYDLQWTDEPGLALMKQGDCFVQPPNIVHREIAHSKNMELIEIVAPADFATRDEPTAIGKPVQRKAAKKPAKKAR